MKRINRSEIDSTFEMFGDPKSAIYAIWFDKDGWLAANSDYAIIYAALKGDSCVAEISEGTREYDIEYLSSADVGTHMLHNGNPALDIKLDSEYLRSNDMLYLCHRCNKAFILEMS